MNDKIVIKGLRQNNLKNISIEIPKNKLVVFTGVSGSGKSSIVFDTIAAESGSTKGHFQAKLQAIIFTSFAKWTSQSCAKFLPG
jgi:excinuclease UvrABC ATPase subunit